MNTDCKRFLLLILIVLLLFACGGGGSSPFSSGSVDRGPVVASAWNTTISADPIILRGNPLFGFQLFSSAAIAANGMIYAGSTDGFLYALDREGDIKWQYDTGDQIVASPAVGNDGTIYVASADRQLYALNPDGTLKWVYPTKSVLTSSPAIATDGTIYVAGTNIDATLICSNPPNAVQFSTFYAVNPNGTLQWDLTLSGPINSSPVIATDGTIYIGSNGDLRPLPTNISFDRIDPCDPTTDIPPSDADPLYPVNGHLYAINPDGTIKWDFKTLGDVHSSAAIANDGTIYIGSDHTTHAYLSADMTDVVEIGSRATGFLYAIDPDGVLIWFTDLYGDVKSSPAIGGDGTIYVGSDKGDVFALDPNGTIIWVFPTRGPIRSSPALGADGTIFIGSNDSRLYALNPEGTLEFEYPANASITSSPSITSDGWVIFATGVPASDEPFVDGDATFYAIEGSVGLAESAWPKFRRDLPNAGRQ